MFQDVGVSKDLNENFKRHLSNSGESDDKGAKTLQTSVKSTTHLLAFAD